MGTHPDQSNPSSGRIEAARKTDPDDCLLSGRLFRFVPFAMSVLEQDEATGRDVPLISVTGVVFGRSIKPHREHAPWNSVPIDLARARRNAREADLCRRILCRYFERHGIGMNLPRACWNLDFIKMRLAIGGGVNSQALH